MTRKRYSQYRARHLLQNPRAYRQGTLWERISLRAKRFFFKYISRRTRILKAEHAIKLERLEAEQRRMNRQLGVNRYTPSEKGKKIQEIKDIRTKINRIIEDNGSYYIA